MRLLNAILGRGKPAPGKRLAASSGRALKAYYDSAETNETNRRHWAKATGVSADAAANPFDRRQTRNRARYERANNSICAGIVETLANDTIGTGPRLMLETDHPEANAFIETEFGRWCEAIGLSEKLHTARCSKCESGEVFLVLATNPALPTRVQLDVRLVEADRVTTPTNDVFSQRGKREVDGIEFDEFGNPVRYHILRVHPGEIAGFDLADLNEYDIVDARNVIHWFKRGRPGQSRGVSEYASALPLFSMLRRFTLATLSSAEIAAHWAGVLHTDAAPDPDSDEAEPFEPIELEPNALLTLPAGYQMDQLKSEHPSTTHEMFKRCIISEMARCLIMPYAVAAGDSSEHNYASGRLDYQSYHRAIFLERASIDRVILSRLFRAWLDEAILIANYIPVHFRRAVAVVGGPAHRWMWPGFEHVDPAKEANGQEKRLQNNTTTLAVECAKAGLDWEDVLRQRAREIELMRSLGLPEPAPVGGGRAAGDDEDEPEAPARQRKKPEARR